jgi:hypothetical protein
LWYTRWWSDNLWVTLILRFYDCSHSCHFTFKLLLYIGLPKILGGLLYTYFLCYTHLWEMMKSVGSSWPSLSLLDLWF